MKITGKLEKSCRWCFTCWDFNSVLAWKTYKLHLVRCMVVGMELCPLTEKLHYQGYVEFKKEYTLGSVKRIWYDNETHWEIAQMPESNCIAYCSKENNLIINHNVISNYLKRDIDWDDVFVDIANEPKIAT